MTPQIVSQGLKDKLWRLSNLYSIKDAETGKVIKFVPRHEQIVIFKALLSGLKKIIILKARRLGMSTGIDVYAADEIAFNAGVQCSILDQTQDDASKKLNGTVKVALDSLPAPLLATFKFTRLNDSSVELCDMRGDTTSAIYAGRNARGGTNQLLHVSEWGVIQADDPRRSEEILTGALPSAEHGVTIIETTWKGGRGGHLWNLVKGAMEMPENQRTENDWHLFFFPWWVDPTYAQSGSLDDIPAEIATYLCEKETETGHKFTDGQKCWYARRKATIGIFMFREFPTTIDECFRAPIEGAIYAQSLDKLRGMGSIRSSPVDNSALVHTFWDIGSPINTVTWYVQFIGTEIRVIDIDANLDLTPVARVARVLGKGYPLGMHYLPHDSATTLQSGRSFQAEVDIAGLKNTRIIPRTLDIWIGINRLREIMPRMTFRIPACEEGIEALSNYHTRSVSNGGIAMDEPVHDYTSHYADALRMLGEAEMHGMIEGGSATARESRHRFNPIVVKMGLSPDIQRNRVRVRR